MTRAKAFELMRKGVKITHTHFHPDEWMIMKGNIIIFEDGYQMFMNDFLKFRNSESWQDGYSVFKSLK